jgi:hypothetical protein
MTFTSKVYDGSLVSESVLSKCGFLGAETTSFFHVYIKPVTVVGKSGY